MGKKRRGLLSIIGERLEIYRREVFLENIFLDVYFGVGIFLFLFLFIFGGVMGYGGRIPLNNSLEFNLLLLGITFLVTFVAWMVKVFSKDGTRKFLFIYLILERKKESVYPLFLFLNLSFFLWIFCSVVGMPFIFGLLAVPILRLLFLGEDVVIQNRILRAAIKETQSYEALTGFSPMVKISTYESLMDLTRIKDQMYRSAQESVQSQKMKTELITNISHDLKTPLTSIINYADILSKKDVMDQEAQNYIRILGRNSERLKSLIVDLIDASKTGTGNVNLEPVFIDFHELINQIYADFDNEYEKKGLDFVYEYTEEYIPIYTDGNVLSRVIQNLFSNVNKYSMENTKVYGRTHLSGDRIFFSLRNISEKEITISAEELQTQFTRGELSRTTEGSGLGLYIAKNLVEILQGEFRIIVDGNYFQVFVELPTELKKDEK